MISGVGGNGLTVILTVVSLKQPFALALIVNNVLAGLPLLLISVPVIGVPDPLAAIPVTTVVLFLVQVNVVPATVFGFVTLIEMEEPEQMAVDAIVKLTLGIGFTVMLTVVSLLHPLAVALTVKIVV
jgi:uncharacterized membrane protein